MKAAINEQRKYKNLPPLSSGEFLKIMRIRWSLWKWILLLWDAVWDFQEERKKGMKFSNGYVGTYAGHSGRNGQRFGVDALRVVAQALTN